jgi:outer membrane lipoprotein carrier protein
MKPINPLARLLLLSWCLTSVAAATAQENSARQQLERFSAGLETLHAKFEQRVISTDGAVADESGGEVWLSRPQKFRWAYGGDFPELVVADGTRIWIYDEALEQVTVKNQSLEASDSPLALLTDPGQLERQFDIREVGETWGLQLLELRSRKTESEFERILLGLNEDRLELMIMEDTFGLRTELRFSDIERNLPLDESLFTFVPPAGADLIGEVPDASQGP